MASPKLSSRRIALLGLFLIAIGAIGFHQIPNMVVEDAAGNKWVNAVYCAVMTLTTVGYGDICPGDISGEGRAFIVFLSLSGMGMFCGPLMDLAATWKDQLPVGGTMTILMITIATSVFLFSYLLEEMSGSEAAYFSIITGTTIGYGDISPKSDIGKILVAFYAILAINVMASVLEPAKEFLLGFCIDPNSIEEYDWEKENDKVPQLTKERKVKQQYKKKKKRA